MTDQRSLEQLSGRVGAALARHGLMLATAESCTGGWVGQAITAVPGSSDWYERGFVVYTYLAKQEMLGVTAATLEAHGAVSEPCAREMATGALERSHAQVAVAVTGIAGPSGGTPDKPVGTVCFAWALAGGPVASATRLFQGDREAVRARSVEAALRGVLELVEGGRR